MWESREQARKEIARILGSQNFAFKDGITKPEEIANLAGPEVILGVGVMPSSCVEPVKAMVKMLIVLKVPRYFKTVGQWYASNL